MMLTQAALKELLLYDERTGAWTWRRTMRGPVRAGDTAGRGKPNGYWSIKIDQVDYYAHRLAFLYMTGAWPSLQVDHISGDRADNRWCNLREATISQNRGNTTKRIGNTSGYKGVSLHSKTQTWRARLGARTIGYYKTKEEAHASYVTAAKEYFGEYARG